MSSKINRLIPVVSEISLKYRPRMRHAEAMQISSSSQAHDAFQAVWDFDTISLKESFKVAFLNRSNRLLGIIHLSEGGISETVVDIRHLIAVALKSNSSSILLAHNHPSGSLKPSVADKVLTKKIIGASHYFDIKTLDHLILTSESYFSMGDEGLIDIMKNELHILGRNLTYPA